MREHFYIDVLPLVKKSINIKHLFNLEYNVYVYLDSDDTVRVYDDNDKFIYPSLELYFYSHSLTCEHHSFDVHVPKVYKSEPSIHVVDYINDKDTYVYLDNAQLSMDLFDKLVTLSGLESKIALNLKKL